MRTAAGLAVATLGAAILAGGAQAAPDFTIEAHYLIGEQEPRAIYVGGTFRAELVVRNIGTTGGDAGWLTVWAHRTLAPGPGQLGEYSRRVGYLAAGQASPRLVFTGLSGGSAYNGYRYFRAYVDCLRATAEQNESNNAKSASYRPVAPDLTVSALSFQPSPPRAGRYFTAYVTVRNIGTGAWNKAWPFHTRRTDVSCGWGGTTKGVGLATYATRLQPGQSVAVPIAYWVVPRSGTVAFRTEVDGYRNIPELNESNNTLFRSVFVAP